LHLHLALVDVGGLSLACEIQVAEEMSTETQAYDMPVGIGGVEYMWRRIVWGSSRFVYLGCGVGRVRFGGGCSSRGGVGTGVGGVRCGRGA